LTFFNSDVDENRGVISTSYSFYNGLKYNVSKILGLPDPVLVTPGSIKLEHISNTFEYMKDKKGFGKSEFIFAFLLALGVDLGAFAIFYFMVLKKND